MPATATDYPEVVSDRTWMDAVLRYRLSGRATVNFQYRYEKYDQVDWAMDRMAPFMGFVDLSAPGTTWVGATRPDYRAHVIALSLRVGF